ncbi:MAG: hypothetical protein HZA54_08740 [Planctomycetes bacterium]|nr:hypothetical protein [Planctomycetota bacterium]
MKHRLACGCTLVGLALLFACPGSGGAGARDADADPPPAPAAGPPAAAGEAEGAGEGAAGPEAPAQAGAAVDPSELDRLIQRLSSSNAAEREAAEAGLCALGEPAVVALRECAEQAPDEDLKARCRRALTRIREEAGRRGVVPPERRVTIQGTNLSLKQALRAWKEQLGTRLNIRGIPQTTVTVDLAGVSPLAALDALARAAGAQYSLRQSDADPAVARPLAGETGLPEIRWNDGPFVEKPAGYARHYRVTAEEISLTQTGDFTRVRRSAGLVLALTWMPDLRPDALTRLDLVRVEDDQGRSLLAGGGGASSGTWFARSGAFGNCRIHHSVPLAWPEADAKSIALLAGRAVMRYRGPAQVLRFEGPDTAAGVAQEVAGQEVTVRSCRRDARTTVVELRAAAANGVGGGRARGEADAFRSDRMMLVLKDGRRFAPNGMSCTTVNDRSDWTLNYDVEEGEPIAALEVEAVLSFVDDAFEFRLTGIPLPR